MENEILQYHMDETARRFDEVREDLKDIKNSIDDFGEFKIKMIATSRLVSFIVSAISSLVTLIISTIITIKNH